MYVCICEYLQTDAWYPNDPLFGVKKELPIDQHMLWRE